MNTYNILSKYGELLDIGLVNLRENNLFNCLSGMKPLQQEEVITWASNEFVRLVLEDARDGEKVSVEEIFSKVKKIFEKNRDKVRSSGSVILVDRYNNILGNASKGIESQWNTLEALVFQKVQQVQGIRLFGEVGDHEGYNEKIDFSKSSLEIDSRDYGSVRLKHFLSVVRDTKRVGNTTITKLGSYLNQPKYISFDKVYSDIKASLTNIDGNYDTFIKKLKELAVSKPYVEQVIGKLEEAKINGEDDLVNEFVSQMNSRTTNMKTIVVESSPGRETKAKIINTNRSNIADLVLDEWNNNLIYSNLVKSGEKGHYIPDEDLSLLISDGESLKSFITLGKRIAIPTGKEQEFFDRLQTWLENLGIHINDELLKRKVEGKNLRYIFHSPAGWGNILISNLKFLSGKTIEEANPLNDSAIKRLARDESYYRPDLQTTSFLNGENNRVSSYLLPDFLSDRILELKKGSDVIDNLLSNPFSSTSLWLGWLARDTGFRDLFNYIILDTFRLDTFKSGTPFNRLDISDLEVAKIGLLSNRGTTRSRGEERVIYIVHPTIAGKDRMMAVSTIAVDTSLEKREGLSGNPLRNITSKISDLYRIEEGKSKDEILSNKEWRKAARVVFDEDKSLKKVIYRKEGIIEETATDLEKERVLNSFMNYAAQVIEVDRNKNIPLRVSTPTAKLVFENVVLPEIRRIIEFQDKDIGIKSFDKGSKKFLLMPELNNKEKFAELWDGDKLKDYDELLKSGAIDRIISYIRDEYLEELIEDRVKFWIDNGIVSSNKGNVTGFGKIDAAYVKAMRSKSLTISNNNDVARQMALDYEVNYLVGNVNFMQLFSSDPAYYYKEIQGKSETDTIERTAYKTYDNIVKRLARHIAPGLKSSEVDETYRVGVIPEIVGSSLYKKLSKKKEFQNITYADGQEWITVEEATYILWKYGRITKKKREQIIRDAYNYSLPEGDLKSILTVQKPVQTGNTQHSTYNTEVPVYIKSSSFTLVPQMVKGTDLEVLLKKMKEANLNRVAVPSAIKLGMPNFGLGSVVDNEGNLIEENLRFDVGNVMTLSRKMFRIKQDVPFDPTKDEVVDGTQQMLLLFESIRNIRSTNPDVRNIEDIYREYISNYRELFNIKREDLKKFLYKEDGTLDVSKVKSMLFEEALRLGLKQDTLDLLSLDDEEFVKHFFYSQSHGSVEAILQALVDKRIRKNMMHGRSLVLGSEFGFRVKGIEELKSLQGVTVETEEDLKKLIEDLQYKRDELVKKSKGRQKQYQEKIDAVRKEGDQQKVLALRKENETLLRRETTEIQNIDDQLKNAKSASETGGRFRVTSDTGIIFTPKFSGQLLPQRVDEKTGRVLPGQVLLPWRMRDSITGKEIDIARYVDENNMLDLSKVSDDVLKIFGYRIPTSKLGSMTMVEVVGFLPVHVGDLVIAPRDLVAQTGMDFDVDKLFMFEYNVVEDNGRIRKFEEKDKIENINNWYSDLTAFGSKIASKINVKLRKQDKELTSRIKYLQNKILDNHLEVMSNKDVFENYVAKTVGYGSLPEIAQTIRERRSVNKKFKPISEAFHRDKYKSSASAETGVGVFSNTITMIAKTQDSDNSENVDKKEIYFLNRFGKKYKLKIGSETSTDISSIKGARLGISKIEVASAFQNASVDDGTLNIIGDLNVNNITFGFIDAMILMGFSEKTIAALLNQDIVVDYVRMLDRSRNSQSSGVGMKESDIVKFLREKYKSDEYIKDKDVRRKRFSGYTSDQLVGLIGKGTEDTFAQNVALDIFREVMELGTYMNRAHTLSGTHSTKFNKSLLHNMLVEEEISKLPANRRIYNIHRIFTDRSGKTNSIPGFALESLKFNNELWSQLLPYNKDAVRTAISEVERVLNVDKMTINQQATLRWRVVEGLKAYIYSRIVESPSKLRQQYLIYDGDTPTLAHILKKIKSSNLYASANPVIRRLRYKLNKKVGSLNYIWFDNTAAQELVMEVYYNAFVELLADDSTIPLDGLSGRILRIQKTLPDKETRDLTDRFHIYYPRKFLSKDKDGKYRIYQSVWHAYQTWKTGEFNNDAYEEYRRAGNVKILDDYKVDWEMGDTSLLNDDRLRAPRLKSTNMVEALESGEITSFLGNRAASIKIKEGSVVKISTNYGNDYVYVRVRSVKPIIELASTPSEYVKLLNERAGYNQVYYNTIVQGKEKNIYVFDVEYIDDGKILEDYIKTSILTNYKNADIQVLLDFDSFNVARPAHKHSRILSKTLKDVQKELADRIESNGEEKIEGIVKRFRERKLATDDKVYRVKDFARDLIILDLLTGSHLSPISYNRLIPFGARKILVDEAIKDIDLINKKILGFTKCDVSVYTEQFLQHESWRLLKINKFAVIESDLHFKLFNKLTLKEGFFFTKDLNLMPKYLIYNKTKNTKYLLKRIKNSLAYKVINKRGNSYFKCYEFNGIC